MKAFMRWLSRIIGSAITIVLVIVLFPHLSRLAAKFMPDESGSAIKASAILSEKLEHSSRLETFRVSADGVLNYDIQAAFIGTVATINARYRYDASFGIDLQKVMMQASGNEITFFLPEVEVLMDNLTPSEIYRDDFWYPGFSDQDYERLLETERLNCREKYLSGEYQEQLWQASLDAFEQTIASWLTSIHSQLVFHYERITLEE